MILSIRDTRGRGTVARDTATSQQHATNSARIYSEVESAHKTEHGQIMDKFTSAVDGTIFIVLTLDDVGL